MMFMMIKTQKIKSNHDVVALRSKNIFRSRETTSVVYSPTGFGWLDGGRCLRCRGGGWRGARSMVRAVIASAGPAAAGG